MTGSLLDFRSVRRDDWAYDRRNDEASLDEVKRIRI